MSNGGEKWVEIIEPTSKEKMFANPATGEIVFAPPEGSDVKPLSNNQWWELFDQSSNRNYYYNVITGETNWTKPGNDADIISLTKVQSSETDQELEGQHQQEPHDGHSSPPGTTLAPVVEETNAIPGVEVANAASPGGEESHSVPGGEATHTTTGGEETHATIQENETFMDTTSTVPKTVKHPSRLSDMLAQEVEAMSPLTMDFPDGKFGHSGDAQTTEEPSAHSQATNGHFNSSDASVLMRDESRKLSLGDMLSYQEQERGSWVNIKLVKDGRVSSDSGSVNEKSWKGGGESGGRLADKKKMLGGSLDRSNRGRDQLSLSTGSEMKARTMEKFGSTKRTREPVRPAPGVPNKSLESKVRSETRLRTESKLRTETKPRASSHYGLLSSSHGHPSTYSSYNLSAPQTPTHDNSDRSWGSVLNTAGPPIAPSFVPPVSKGTLSGGKSTVGSSLDKFEYLAKHRVGLFRKKVTIANMLSWTKDPIKQPMILTRDRNLKKEAIDLFRLVLQYMGDRRTKFKDTNLLGLEICRRAWEKKELRDEVYIQLCRQTSGNVHYKSLEKGWELISICLAFFPPSIRFRSYLEGYLWRNVEHKPEHKSVPVEVYAGYCHKKIEKMAQSGAKKGLKKPNIEEVMHAKLAPFHPSMFGTSLEEVMEMQKEKFPDCRMPWVVEALVKAILELEGSTTEGIFRVPGDIDEVNGLKLQMDKGLLPMDTLKDPHVPASLLKLWFRELEDPLIPQAYYHECVSNCDDQANAVSLVESLPDFNKELLMYLIRFLKLFVTVDNISKTKMGIENIAMVWAPNFLRCPSEDHALIFENTRKEMAFLRLLLNFLEIEDI